MQGGLVCELQGIVHWEGECSVGKCTLGVQIFLNLSMKLTNQQQPKVQYVIKIDQSQMSDGKTASRGRMLLMAK